MFTEIATFATEPELKKIQVGDSERSVMNGRIAINQGKDRASFVNVTAWGKLAEYIGTYYHKGDEIYIEGEIRNSNYKTDDRTLQTNYILINTVKATFGQKSRRTVAADFEPDTDSIIDDAELIEPPKRGRRKKDDADLDDSE